MTVGGPHKLSVRVRAPAELQHVFARSSVSERIVLRQGERERRGRIGLFADGERRRFVLHVRERRVEQAHFVKRAGAQSADDNPGRQIGAVRLAAEKPRERIARGNRRRRCRSSREPGESRPCDAGRRSVYGCVGPSHVQEGNSVDGCVRRRVFLRVHKVVIAVDGIVWSEIQRKRVLLRRINPCIRRSGHRRERPGVFRDVRGGIRIRGGRREKRQRLAARRDCAVLRECLQKILSSGGNAGELKGVIPFRSRVGDLEYVLPSGPRAASVGGSVCDVHLRARSIVAAEALEPERSAPRAGSRVAADAHVA